MLTLLLGTDWISNRQAVLNRVARDVAQKKPGRLLIVPELISHETERRLCSAAGDTSSRYAEVLSFSRLARRVSEATGMGEQPCLDKGGRVVAMAAAARQLRSRLKSYASVETKPEFLSGLLDAVDEFKRCCITPADLQAASRKTEGSFAQKLEELALLLESYDAVCARGKRDPRDQMTWLLEQLEDSDFASRHVLYIDGFPDFTRQHMAILEHMIANCPDVVVSLNCDSLNSSRLAFEKASDTAAEFIKAAKKNGIAWQIQTEAARNLPLSAVLARLFQGRTEYMPQLQGYLKTVRYDTPFTECTAVAERIRTLVQQGARYRDISVVCCDLSVYKNILPMIFERFGIPCYLSGTEDILEKSVITTVLSAMDAALGGLEQKDVLRYLKSVLSPLEISMCDQVENYAVTWNISGKKWLSTWKNHPAGLESQWTEEDKAVLEALNAARAEAVEPLHTMGEQFRHARNLAQQTEALYDFLEQIHVAERLDKLAEKMDALGDNRNAQILNQLWEILLTALEQLHDVLGETSWEPETFTRLFRLLLSQYDVGTIPPVLDTVTVGAASAMRCQQEKYLFVLGAMEGSFPGYGGAAGVLTDQERVALRAMGVTLTGGSVEGLQAEFAEIYGVFCGAEISVQVSCPGGQPSFVFKRLCDLSGGEENGRITLGAAAADLWEASALLARHQAGQYAPQLGLTETFADINKARHFHMGSISRPVIEQLYGKRFRLSASQINRQAECRMSYFLKYGLNAKERRTIAVDPAEFGTYVHTVLEKTGREVMSRGGFHRVSLEEVQRIASDFSDRYARETFGALDSERFSYMFHRNSGELAVIVRELWQELAQSEFEPAGFEVSFGCGGKLDGIPANGQTMRASLRGFVDRLDTWHQNGQCYYRVVDYKTGKKDFDYCDVFNGIGLQMLLYLFALEQAGTDLLGEHAVPAGVQYFPARAPLVPADGILTEEEAEEARQKLWKRKGLLLMDDAVLTAMEPGEKPVRLSYSRKKDGSVSGDLADRDQLKLLRSYVFSLLKKMVDTIASGNIAPNPYTRGNSYNACSFCPYGMICHRSEVEGRRNYKAMTADAFWDFIRKEMKQDG